MDAGGDLKAFHRHRHQRLSTTLDFATRGTRLRQYAFGIESRRHQLGFVECPIALSGGDCCGGSPDHLEPHPAERDHAHALHIGIGGSARIVRVGHCVLDKPHRRGLKLAECLLELECEILGCRIGLGSGNFLAK